MQQQNRSVGKSINRWWTVIAKMACHPALSEKLRYIRARGMRLTIVLLTLLACVSAVGTYHAMTSEGSYFGPDPGVMTQWFVWDGAVLLAMITIVALRMMQLWLSRRRQAGGGRLHIRMIGLFSVVAVAPVLAVSAFSFFFFHLGIQAWFHERVQTALSESSHVAHAYFLEAQAGMRHEILTMMQDLRRQSFSLRYNPAMLTHYLERQITLRGLSEAMVFERHRVLARTAFSMGALLHHIPEQVLAKADRGEVAFLTMQTSDIIRTIVPIASMPGMYLLVGRYVDPKVLLHVEKTQTAAAEYQLMAANIQSLELKFFLIFTMLALLVLLLAVWCGIHYATVLVKPLMLLMQATIRVRRGDWDWPLPMIGHARDEIGVLHRGFSQMLQTIREQRNELMAAYRAIEHKNHFHRMVLAGVSTAIVVLDEHLVPTLMNQAADKLFSTGRAEGEGPEVEATDIPFTLADALPELHAKLVLHREHQTVFDGSMEIESSHQGRIRHVLVRCRPMEDSAMGHYLITCDDISALLIAKKHATFSDVARRIAHEIKNPLTPIQLAAERLQRFSHKEASPEQQEAVVRYAQTISRNVGTIANIIEAFVNFSRMPVPQLIPVDIEDTVKEFVWSRQVTQGKFVYSYEGPSHPVWIFFDPNQLLQILNNLCKNAEEAMAVAFQQQDHENPTGFSHPTIRLSVALHDNFCILEVQDMGPGFPMDQIDRLADPYVTMRKEGTGLGLAIVKKIVEDHHAFFSFGNRLEGGGCVTIRFPLLPDNEKEILRHAPKVAKEHDV
jgi:two-component system nitrogen regulation sensor histidine kinase NtrY